MAGLRVFGNRRDGNEAALVSALRKGGVMVKLTDKPTDAVALYRGSVHLLEFKTPNGHLTLSQQKLRGDSWPVYFLRSLDDVATFLSGRSP